PPELAHRSLAAPPRRDAALHADQRILAEPGRIGPAHPGPPCPRRPASPVAGGPDRLARRHRRRLERQPNPLRLARQALRAPTTRSPASPWRLTSLPGPSPAKCGV